MANIIFYRGRYKFSTISAITDLIKKAICLWDPLWDAPFSACRKMEILHVVINKVEIYLAKYVLLTAVGPIWMPQGHMPLGDIHFWGPLLGAFFSACRKMEILHMAVNEVENILQK